MKDEKNDELKTSNNYYSEISNETYNQNTKQNFDAYDS